MLNKIFLNENQENNNNSDGEEKQNDTIKEMGSIVTKDGKKESVREYLKYQAKRQAN